MLQFLQTGKALYVLAAVCGLGIISKLVTSSLYKRLIKETGNMALTKNKNLRSLKQKTENMFLLNHGIRNVGAYIDKQLYGFRFMKLSLDAWENFSVQAMILCFLLGGIAAFGAYWYRCDSYYIVLYGTVGILSGLLLVLVDNGTNVSLKRQQLTDVLVDYVENSPHFYRGSGKQQEPAEAEPRMSATASAQKERLRGIGKNRRNMAESTAKTEAEGREGSVGNREAAATDADGTFGVVPIERTVEEKESGLEKKSGGKRLTLLSRKKGRREPEIQQAMKSEGSLTQEAELAKSIDSLKQSLDQIAASRELARRDLQVVKPQENEKLERARKELSAEDLKFLGELLQEYLT